MRSFVRPISNSREARGRFRRYGSDGDACEFRESHAATALDKTGLWGCLFLTSRVYHDWVLPQLLTHPDAGCDQKLTDHAKPRRLDGD